jgi:hypothetical protein
MILADFNSFCAIILMLIVCAYVRKYSLTICGIKVGGPANDKAVVIAQTRTEA